MLVLLAIPALSLLFLQNSQVQTRISQFIAEKLSEQLQASISLSSVNYSFFKRVQVRDLFIEDHNGDTLLYSELTKLRIKQLRSDRKGIEIRKATLENAFVNLVIDSSGVLNMDLFVKPLKKPHVPPAKKMRLYISDIELVNSRFSFTKMNSAPMKSAFNANDMKVTGLQIKAKDLLFEKDTLQMEILGLSAAEQSGFRLDRFSCGFMLAKTQLQFREVRAVTERSDLSLPLATFSFDDYQQFEDFPGNVDLNFRFEQSVLMMEDLAYFLPGAHELQGKMDLNGRIHGTLSDLRGEDLLVTYDDKSSLAFDFIMIGLPRFDHTFLDFYFRELSTSSGALNQFTGSSGDSAAVVDRPWNSLGDLGFVGRFTGYADNFVAAGLLETDLGSMVMDLSFEPDTLRGVDFNGHLKTTDFRLGEFLRQETVGQLDMDVITDGSLYRGKIQARLKGNIDTLEFYNYAYSNITLDGSFTNNTFEGGISIVDPNIKMDFLGRMDFSGEVPAYNFTADVARARPYYLNLPQNDPNYFASFLVETDLTGKTLDEMNGELKLINSLFERSDAQLQLYNMVISTVNTPDSSSLKISSDLFNALVEGRYRLSELPASFRNMADRYMNVLPRHKPQIDTINRFAYHMDFKRLDPILDFFLPTLQIGDQSHLEGVYDPARSVFTLMGFSPEVRIGPNGWRNVDLFSEIENGEFQLHFQSDSMTYGKSFSLVEQQFAFTAANNNANLEVSWDNRIAPRYRGKLKVSAAFQPDSVEERGLMIEVEPSTIQINNDLWDIPYSHLLVKKGYIQMDSVALISGDRHLLARGTMSADADHDFVVDVRNMDLHQLSGLAGINARLDGSVTGNINYKRLEGIPYVFSDLHVDTLNFNGQLLGETELNAVWNEERGAIDMNLLSMLEGTRIVEIDGTYTPGSEYLDYDIHLNGFQLHTLNPYITNVVTNLEGLSNISLTLDGTLKNPELNGTIGFEGGAATLTFLNTRYTFNDRIRVYNNNLYIEDFILNDEFGHTARVEGTISNNYLKDFYTNIKLEADNLLCMNTSPSDNEVFYGTIHATGGCTISGPPDRIRIQINGKTERNTAIFLPLYNASEVQTSDFITFIQEKKVDESSLPGGSGNKSRMEMELEVNVTPDAVVQLIFDPKVGDIIETSGQGDLRMEVEPGNVFNIFGDVELIRGDYLFTLQNVINKRFEIEPGGKIFFNGSPTNATVDLNAIYTTRVAPFNLYPGSSSEVPEELKRRIPVECNLYLQGDLQRPTISTGISLPTADPQTRGLLENSTSTEEELMRQFLSLLVINNFYSVSGGTLNMGTVNSSTIAGVTASELLSNQLSNWLSQISDDFDIGVNYRPGDQISRDEVEVALSTQLLDDRIIITGNVDLGGQETNPSAGASSNPYIMGDFDVEFKVTDNVSILAFNRARDELLSETAPYKQGVGISYQEEFNSLRQLMNRYREGIANRKRKRNKTRDKRSAE